MIFIIIYEKNVRDAVARERSVATWRRIVPQYEDKLLKRCNLNFNTLHQRYELAKKIINIS